MRAVSREREAFSGCPPPSHMARPVSFLLPVLFTLDKQQSQRHTPSKAEASEKQTNSGLGKAPPPLAAFTFRVPITAGVGQHVFSPFPPLCKPPPDDREEKAHYQMPPPAADTPLDSHIVFPREVLCPRQPLALSVYPPASVARPGRGGAPASIPAGHRVFSFKGFEFGFLVLP